MPDINYATEDAVAEVTQAAERLIDELRVVTARCVANLQRAAEARELMTGIDYSRRAAAITVTGFEVRNQVGGERMEVVDGNGWQQEQVRFSKPLPIGKYRLICVFEAEHDQDETKTPPLEPKT